jgi:hypothetical protein
MIPPAANRIKLNAVPTTVIKRIRAIAQMIAIPIGAPNSVIAPPDAHCPRDVFILLLNLLKKAGRAK